MADATLIAHVDSTYRSRAELALIPTPAGTATWKPIGHYDLVDSITAELERRDIAIVRERFAVGGPRDARLFGVMDLRVGGFGRPDVGMALGIRGANDKSLRLSIVTGARVFVCDNMAFSGDAGAVLLSRKHTSGLDLSEVVPRALDAYMVKSLDFTASIDRMRSMDVSDERAKGLIYDAFLCHGVMANRYLPEVHRLYFDDEQQREKFRDRTLWSLNNAFTEAVKQLAAGPQGQAGIAIGRYFGRVAGPGATATRTQVVVPGEALAEYYEPNFAVLSEQADPVN
jgi:hypothetical protein